MTTLPTLRELNVSDVMYSIPQQTKIARDYTAGWVHEADYGKRRRKQLKDKQRESRKLRLMSWFFGHKVSCQQWHTQRKGDFSSKYIVRNTGWIPSIMLPGGANIWIVVNFFISPHVCRILRSRNTSMFKCLRGGVGVGVNKNSFYGAVVFSNKNNAITTPFHKKCKLIKDNTRSFGNKFVSFWSRTFLSVK